MAEEIERIQEKLQFKDKQIIVLQELHDSQQHFSAELNKKLDNSQNKLKGTEQLISSQAEQYKKAKCTIREQEYLIMKLLHSESIHNDHVHCLQSELDLAVADSHGWFHKIEHQDSIEEKKKMTVQRLQSQLHILHKLVSTSVMQQESQLKEIEEGLQSFISEKAVAAKVLEGLVDKLKLLYGSRITALDCIAGEIDQKSQLTFGKVYSQALAHSSSINDCFKRNAIEADYLIKELQCKLSNQKCKLNEFGQLQHEGRLKMVEATHPISNTVASYFHTSEVLVLKLSKILEQTNNSHYQQLSDLEKKFEEFSAYEEKQLAEKVVQMLATTNVRQKKLIQTTADILRESVADRTSALEKEISNAQNYTSLAKEQWRLFMEETENKFFEDTAEVERRKFSLEEHLNDCIQMNEMDSLIWENAHDCLLSLGNAAVESMELIVRNGLDANQLLHANLSSTATIALGNLDALKKSLRSSINGSLKLHHDACESINSIINPSLRDLWDLKTEHYNRIVQITDCIDKSLKQEYMADEPSFSMPRMRSINFPGAALMEDLKPEESDQEILEGIWESESACKKVNEEVRSLSSAFERF